MGTYTEPKKHPRVKIQYLEYYNYDNYDHVNL